MLLLLSEAKLTWSTWDPVVGVKIAGWQSLNYLLSFILFYYLERLKFHGDQL